MTGVNTYGDRLQRSFSALYAYVETPRTARRVVSVLLLIQSGLLAYSAYVHSPTLNEPAHLAAGLSHWRFGQFQVYCVNPPLVRMVAALPVMAVGYDVDWSGFYEGAGARPEFAMGEDLVAANGERSLFLVMIARCACIPFSWLGALVCYLWGRDLYGRPSGVLACMLWCFEPNILAHASLISPDAHASALGLAACYTFWRWLRSPTWTQAALTGVVLGLAELAKTTLILFYPLWPLIWVIYRLTGYDKIAAREWLRQGGMLVLRMLIGLYILNLGYGFEQPLQRLKDFRFVSNLFTGDTAEQFGRQAGSGDAPSVNRFVGSWLGELPVPFPESYLIGIDLQQRDFENHRRPSYLRGEWRSHGWWYYYLYAAAIKVPAGLLLVGTLLILARALKHIASPEWRDEFVLFAPALIIFAVASYKTGFSEHFRYVLPALPFVIVWFGQSMIMIAKARSPWISIAAAMLLTWSVTSSLCTFPHSLSYFNEAVGGPMSGHHHLVSSNIDWGQDLVYLKSWLDANRVTEPLYLAYFGAYDPANLKIKSSGLPPPIDSHADLNHLPPGWYAISRNFLSGYPYSAYADDGIRHHLLPGALSFYDTLSPTHRAGASIYIYRINLPRGEE